MDGRALSPSFATERQTENIISEKPTYVGSVGHLGGGGSTVSRPSDCRGGISRRSYRLFILSVNGINILEGNASLDSIYDSLSKLKPGERMVTKVLRAGQVIELSTMITQ
jgi:hypothetical protein